MTYGKDALLDLRVIADPQKVREAIAAGADVNARNEHGSTPLHLCRGLQTAKLLIAAGADVNARNSFGWTPLHLGKNPEFTVGLLEAGADWTIQTLSGSDALEFAREWDDVEIAEAIEDWVATKTARDRAEAMSEQLKATDIQQGPGL